jgi:hypothetical protein
MPLIPENQDLAEEIEAVYGFNFFGKVLVLGN